MEAFLRIIGQVSKTRTAKIGVALLIIFLTLSIGYFYFMPLIIVALIIGTVWVMVKAAKKVLAN